LWRGTTFTKTLPALEEITFYFALWSAHSPQSFAALFTFIQLDRDLVAIAALLSIPTIYQLIRCFFIECLLPAS
jgi:hypothetical protein